MRVNRCSKCNFDYRDGYTSCPECGTMLIPVDIKEESGYQRIDFAYLKLAVWLVFGIVCQIVVIMISYSFYFTYKLKNEGSTPPMLDNIPGVMWCGIAVEIVLALIVLRLGLRRGKKDE